MVILSRVICFCMMSDLKGKTLLILTPSDNIRSSCNIKRVYEE